MTDFFSAWQLTVKVPEASTYAATTVKHMYPTYDELRHALAGFLNEVMYAWCVANGRVFHYYYRELVPRRDPVLMFNSSRDEMRNERGLELVQYQIDQLSFEDLVAETDG